MIAWAKEAPCGTEQTLRLVAPATPLASAKRGLDQRLVLHHRLPTSCIFALQMYEPGNLLRECHRDGTSRATAILARTAELLNQATWLLRNSGARRLRRNIAHAYRPNGCNPPTAKRQLPAAQ